MTQETNKFDFSAALKAIQKGTLKYRYHVLQRDFAIRVRELVR